MAILIVANNHHQVPNLSRDGNLYVKRKILVINNIFQKNKLFMRY